MEYVQQQQPQQIVYLQRPQSTAKRVDGEVEEPVTHKILGKDVTPARRVSTPVKYFPRSDIEDVNRMRMEMEQMDKLVLKQAREIKVAHHPSADQSSI